MFRRRSSATIVPEGVLDALAERRSSLHAHSGSFAQSDEAFSSCASSSISSFSALPSPPLWPATPTSAAMAMLVVATGPAMAMPRAAARRRSSGFFNRTEEPLPPRRRLSVSEGDFPADEGVVDRPARFGRRHTPDSGSDSDSEHEEVYCTGVAASATPSEWMARPMMAPAKGYGLMSSPSMSLIADASCVQSSHVRRSPPGVDLSAPSAQADKAPAPTPRNSGRVSAMFRKLSLRGHSSSGADEEASTRVSPAACEVGMATVGAHARAGVPQTMSVLAIALASDPGPSERDIQ